MEAQVAIDWLKEFNDQVQEQKSYLTELDTPIGDADHGNNMSRGMKAVMDMLNEKKPETASDIFKETAMTLISKVGGASGPLYGTAFLNMSKVVEENDLAKLFEEGLAGIQKRGKAEPGEKTMVDIWDKAIELVKEDNFTPDSIEEAVEETKPIKATKGRASYVGERSIGHIDPGTYSSALLFKSLLKVTEGN